MQASGSWRAILVLCAALTGGCANEAGRLNAIAQDLQPGGDAAIAEQIYAARLSALVALAGLDRSGKASFATRASDDSRFTPLSTSLAKLARPAQSPLVEPVALKPGAYSYSGNWRIAEQTLFLAPKAKDASDAAFAFSGLHALSTQIAVTLIDAPVAKITLTCDGALLVKSATGNRDFAAGEPVSIRVEAGDKGDTDLLLLPSAELNKCTGSVSFSGKSRSLTLEREDRANPGLADFDSRFDICAPGAASAPPLEKAFFASRWLSQTCAFDPGAPRPLKNERDGFNAKVKALLGTPLPERFFAEGDPGLPLDFSNAPDLSLIYVSYLDIKADFSGRVMERLLRHHAARGTVVRILTSAVLERDKDRMLLERLAAAHANIAFRSFEWEAPAGSGAEDRLSEFHKVHHVKMLATLARQAGKSVAIIGGRNIHDGFLFKKPVDLTAYPELQQYTTLRGLNLNYYSNWSDFDVAITGEAAVRTMAAHLSTLWHADAKTYIGRPFSLPARTGARPKGRLARHFISVPYADGAALETYYADLINAASETIEIVNPYLSLTPVIGAAIEAALDRGVKVTIVGRIDMSGDLGGAILTAVNQIFVEKHAGRIAIYDYKEPGVLLHSKILMIDGRLVTLSGVNLNHRSFIHDTENGLTVLDPAFYRQIRRTFEAYCAASVPVKKADVSLAWRLLMTSRTFRNAL